MSTNDSFVVVATGRGDAQPIASLDDPRCGALERAIGEVAHELALAIVRDGEGAQQVHPDHGRKRPQPPRGIDGGRTRWRTRRW